MEWQEPGVSSADSEWLEAFGALAHSSYSERASANASNIRSLQGGKGAKAQAESCSNVYQADSEDDGPDESWGLNLSIFRRLGQAKTAQRRQLPHPPLTTLETASVPARQRVWLERQRVFWRNNRLSAFRTELMYAAGWRSAH